MSESIMYQGDTRSKNRRKKTYYGAPKTEFQTRYANHKKSFSQQKYKNDTKLSNEHKL